MRIKHLSKSIFLSITIGTIFFCIGIYYGLESLRFKNSGIHVIGTVIHIEYVRYTRSRSSVTVDQVPTINYKNLDDEIITFIPSSRSSLDNFTIDDQVDVLYLPDEKGKQILYRDLWFYFITFILTGVLLPLFGLFAFLKMLRNAYLKARGQKVTAIVNDVRQLNNFLTLGKSSFKIYAHWQKPYTLTSHEFISDTIGFNPSFYLPENKSITVYIDRSNPKRYYMDLSFLPEDKK